MKVKLVHQKWRLILGRVLFVVVVVAVVNLFVVLFSPAKVQPGVVVGLAVFNNIWQSGKSDPDFCLSLVDFVDGIR